MRKETTKKLYEDVRKEYERLSSIQEFGVQKHHEDWIRSWLANRFYKSKATIENIIFYRV